MESRKGFSSKSPEHFLQVIEGVNRPASVAFPIIVSGDVTGAVIMLKSEDDESLPNDTQVKLIQTAAAFLGKHLEA